MFGLGVNVSILGDKELDQLLKSLEPKLAKKYIRQAERKALQPTLAVAEALTPVGETGKLKESLKIVPGKRSRSAIKYKVSTTNEDETWYAAKVHLGTKYQPPQKWLTTALDTTDDDAIEIFEAAMRAALTKEWH